MKLSYCTTTTAILLLALVCQQFIISNVTSTYRYTRRRFDKGHLRVSEYFKADHINDQPHIYISSEYNKTYSYYENDSPRSHSITYDQLIFEAIDRINEHRLSPFYIYTYDNDEDRKRSSDPNLVSQNQCRKHVNYLVNILKQQRQLKRQDDISINIDHYQDRQTTPELAAFFDSYGKQEAGILLGNVYWTGDHHECVHRRIFHLDDSQTGGGDDGVIDFEGRYCVASLKSPIWSDMSQDRLATKGHFFKSDTQRHDYAKLFRLQLGICLPKTCDSNSLEHLKDELTLLTTSNLESPFKYYDLFDLYCLPDETSPLRQMDTSASLFVCVVCFWLAIIALATYKDITRDTNYPDEDSKKHNHKSIKNTLIKIFSLRANYNKFMHVEQVHSSINANHKDQQPDLIVANSKQVVKNVTDQQAHEQVSNPSASISATTTSNNNNSRTTTELDLRFLNAIKAMAMLWIINSHIMLLTAQTTKNVLDCDGLLNILIHFFIGGTFGVDLFFTMTGFLAAYVLFNKGQAFKMNPFVWLYLFFHRYWRLAPMYLMAFWFSKSVVHHLGSGPLWDYGTSNITFRGLCNQESWWFPATLTSNLQGIYDECIITSWYISCDMQFWLASPIIIYLLAKSPLLGWSFSGALIVASCALRFTEIYESESANYLEMVRPRADVFRRVGYDVPRTYTHPQYRICTYIVGILAGHFVYMVKSGKWRSKIYDPMNPGHPSKSRSALAIVGMVLTVLMSTITYSLNHYYPESWDIYAKELATICHSVDHFMMGLGVSLIFVTMSFGQWQQLKNQLSHPFLIRLSRVNYALLLLQCEAIYYQIFRYNFIPQAGTRELLSILLNLFITLYPVGLLVTLLVEFPLANLEKEFIAKKITASSSQRAPSENKKITGHIDDETMETNKDCISTKTAAGDYATVGSIKNHFNDSYNLKRANSDMNSSKAL